MRVSTSADAVPDRLDKKLVLLLRAAGEAISREAVRRLVEDGFVRVAGLVVRDPSAKLRPASEVEVILAPPPPTDAEADASVVIDVVYEDEFLVVVNKPAGLVVHPAKGHASGTLVNGLLARGTFARLLGIAAVAAPDDAAQKGEGEHARPGIVHRLDKGTSGLMVVAKDAETREALKELFAIHSIDREYVALVVGTARDATIDAPHGRHATDRLRFTSSPRGPSKRAVTHIRVLERFRGAALVACTLETGRTHQIRVHLAERIGAPVLGDPLYGRRPADPFLAKLAEELGHQALHARVLGFVHPRTGRAVRWESSPPSDFASVLVALRAR